MSMPSWADAQTRAEVRAQDYADRLAQWGPGDVRRTESAKWSERFRDEFLARQRGIPADALTRQLDRIERLLRRVDDGLDGPWTVYRGDR